MSSPRALTALARSRPASNILLQTQRATFATTPRQRATSEGPPPANFRIPKPKRYNETGESVWNQAGNYFLLTEMMRGMYVVLEQFFRPPYAFTIPTHTRKTA